MPWAVENAVIAASAIVEPVRFLLSDANININKELNTLYSESPLSSK